MPSVGDPDGHNLLGGPGLSLVSHAVLLMPLRGHKGHEMHPCGFIVSEKSHLEKQTWPSILKCMVSLDSA